MGCGQYCNVGDPKPARVLGQRAGSKTTRPVAESECLNGTSQGRGPDGI